MFIFCLFPTDNTDFFALLKILATLGNLSKLNCPRLSQDFSDFLPSGFNDSLFDYVKSALRMTQMPCGVLYRTDVFSEISMNYQEYFFSLPVYFISLGLCLKISTKLTKNLRLGVRKGENSGVARVLSVCFLGCFYRSFLL